MYEVIKSTTDKLQEHLDAVATSGGVLVGQPQWQGGRDWILFVDSDPKREQGWHAEMVNRHSAFYAEMRRRDEAGQVGWYTEGLPNTVTLVEPELEWGNIRYGTYDSEAIPGWTGWVEDRARTWIIFLGPHHSPVLYWPRRGETGDVIGDPIDLTA